MTPIERKARELLAAEYEKAGYPSEKKLALSGSGAFTWCAIRALITALTPPAGGLPELPEPDGLNEIESVEHPYYYEDTLHAYALEAIAASRVGWLPIESAPEGIDDVQLWDGGDVMVGFRMRPHRRWFARDESTNDLHQVFPTHWQPLAAAPQVALNRGWPKEA